MLLNFPSQASGRLWTALGLIVEGSQQVVGHLISSTFTDTQRSDGWLDREHFGWGNLWNPLAAGVCTKFSSAPFNQLAALQQG